MSLSSVELAQKTAIYPITEIALRIGVLPPELELYGKYKAKVSLQLLNRLASAANGKLINVTSITPTQAGEGKTCLSIGLAQALGKLGKKVALCLREPSLGPVFGTKGGGTGGGYSQVLPMEDINLHFTGDIHAIGAAHNLLAALVDNHIHMEGNSLDIDPQRVIWRRVLDISDRQLRNVVVGLGGKSNGFPRETGFDITVASEIMAIVALSENMDDLKGRLGRIIVGFSQANLPVTAGDLRAVGAMALLLKDTLKPNLVQTMEGQPAFVHCGPFANIAHGNNSILATRMALKLADYVVTESGFGSDLGSEKFFHIVCRQSKIRPDAVVIVVTVRALKIHGGVISLAETEVPNVQAVTKGLENLGGHINNIKQFSLPLVVAINRFSKDTEEEISVIKEFCNSKNVSVEEAHIFTNGGEGGVVLAQKVLQAIEEVPNNFNYLYELSLPIKAKIECLAVKVYGANGVSYSPLAIQDIERLTKLGFDELPICMARTQLSFSDDPHLKGAPTDWTLKVRGVKVSAGAGFLVVLTGEMMLMPGLPKSPAAYNMDVDSTGQITGLF